MTAATDTPTIYTALAAVMGDVQAVKKGDRNSQQGYNFRGIDAVVNAVGPVLRKHGVIAVPHSTEAHYRDVLTNTGKPSRECTVKVCYRFYGPAGDHLDVEVPGESMDFGDKGAPKAMSVAYRIALLQALCIPTDDAEPDSQSYEREAHASPPPPPPAPPVRVTDLAWMDEFEKRVTAAGTATEMQALLEEARTVYREGRLTDSDALLLKEATDARLLELGASV